MVGGVGAGGKEEVLFKAKVLFKAIVLFKAKAEHDGPGLA